ncbi:MAG: HAD family hydrolase [Ilumatobacteraceae bacterium]
MRLPSWRPGATRDALLAFLDASATIAPEDRVAVFDNDGTLWCEKPAYPQLAFCVHELGKAVAADPTLAERQEYAALLERDHALVAELGLPRIGMALAELFAGMTADEFAARVRGFLHAAPHPIAGRPFAGATYAPMHELIDELRAAGFTVFIVTGGGTEFVRAISQQVYGVPPEGVVGTLVGYEYVAGDGAPTLVRTNGLSGDANEGVAKVVHIQQHLGRRPVFAAGNSAGDREMIEWALAADGPTLGLLVHHDDAEREAAYASVAGTFDADEDIVEVAMRQGWTVVSMRDDWTTVFG